MGGGAEMSDALTDISKETKAKMEWSVAIHFFANRIYKQLRHVKNREDWDKSLVGRILTSVNSTLRSLNPFADLTSSAKDLSVAAFHNAK